MGWKAFKEKFNIKHQVVVDDEKGICIGSGYVHDLAVVNTTSGVVTENRTFNGFLRENYPTLLEASAQEVLELLAAPDSFEKSITVYTYDGGNIIEKLCEEPDWPNVTHDGRMMYENTFSTDKEKVIKWAKKNVEAGIKYSADCIAETERELDRLKKRLAQYEADKLKLDTDYPTPLQAG